MKNLQGYSAVRLIVCGLFLLVCQNVFAVNEGDAAVTTGKPTVEIKELQLMLLPLTRAELEVEALGWQRLLQEKVRQLTQGEIRVHQLAMKAEKAAQQKQNKKTEQVKEVEEELIVDLAALRLEQAALATRLEAVLNELDKKGGDTEEMKLYASAVSGIKIQASNLETIWLATKGWLSSPEGGVSMLINLIKFVIAMIVVVMLANVAGRIADRLTKTDKVSSLLEGFIRMASRRTVLIVGFIASLSILGINIGPVLALIGAAGLVIGLALQNTLSNFASGMLILIYRPYDIGDLIEVGGVTGWVHSMTLLSTSIKTLDNQHIIIPNNSVWGSAITNVTGSKTRRVDLVFGIGYGDDFTVAQKIMQKILDDHPKVLDEPAPVVRVHELGDSSVNLVCRPWVKTQDYWDVHWDVIESVKREFDAQGVSIPFPQRDVHLFPAGELSVNQTNT